MSAALRSVGLLDALSSAPPGPSVATPCIHARLHPLATNHGEKCGLVRRLAALVGLLCLIFGNPAHAACRVTTTGLNFGAYDVFAPMPRDTAGTVTVACDRNPPTDVTISIGPSPASGGFNPRRMRHAMLPDRLDYNLFISPSMGTVWGDGSAGTSAVLLRKVNRNRPATAMIYGRIPPGQNVSVGSYTDTLTVTITP